MVSQNRLHTNGHHRSPSLPISAALTADVVRKPTLSMRDVEKLAQQYPGSVLVAGLVTGGIVGWLTLKLSR